MNPFSLIPNGSNNLIRVSNTIAITKKLLNEDNLKCPIVKIPVGKLKWKFGTQGWVSSSPTIKDGRVYFGSDDNYLYAVNKYTGKLEWKFKTEDRIISSPSIMNDLVYFIGPPII